MSDRVFTADQTNKLTQIINEGMSVDIKPNILKKAIKLAHKSEFGREQQDHELLEQILVQVGKTL
jgi:hypothetical protein